MITVLIIGLKQLHVDILKSKFKGIKFTAINHEGRYTSLPNGDNFNFIFNLTRFSNHNVHNKYKSHSDYECIEGGRSILINSLKAKLA